MYCEYQKLSSLPTLSGWEVVEESNCKDVSQKIPVATHGEFTLTFEPLTFDFFLF